ncbi:MAG TPA: aminopeptidase, partial [Sphingobacterium sp.]|nr:aminopeptidase [Sphingobacterium sp.]
MKGRTILNYGLTLLLLTGAAHAQELYTPRNIQQAIAKGTRTTTGIPGKNYWQNFGKYDVRVQLDPATKMVSGT